MKDVMELDCGCVADPDDCCGICAHAAAVGRPRLSRDNAGAWVPPSLNKLKGEKHRSDREADAGEPMMWFWQMTGRRWDLDSKVFDVEVKAWKRLAASREERREESAKRQARSVAEQQRIDQEEIDRAREEEEATELEEAQRVQEERARRWREIRAVLRRCGLLSLIHI